MKPQKEFSPTAPQAKGEDRSLNVLKAAISLHQQGNLSVAKKLYDEILIDNPSHFDALHLLGVIASQSGMLNEAEKFYAKAIRISSKQAAVHYNLGKILQDQKRFDEALQSYNEAISIKSDYAEALSNRGNTLKQLKRFDEALQSYNKAISIKPDYAEAFYNRGNTLKELTRFGEALASYDIVTSIKPDYAGAFNNRGNMLAELKRYDDALASFATAILIKSDYAEAFNNRGNTLKEMKHFEEALANYEKAISIQSDYIDAFYNRGNTLKDLRRFDEALDSYDKAISIQSDYEWLFGSWLNTRMQISEWSNLERHLGEFRVKIQDMKSVTNPFPVLALFDDLELNSKAARQWIDNKFPCKLLDKSFEKKGIKEKICIGYFSTDFRQHPMSQLMAGIFETHDKSKFELIAFSFCSHTPDNMTARIKQHFNQFIDVSLMNDLEVVELSRQLRVDIAIDLMGFTAESRTGIFALHCAPIQVNFLGYPGTMSADYIDYIIADETIIPQGASKFYREKIVYLPDTYYPNSYKNDENAGRTPSRQFQRDEIGLPLDRFVFCCFNNIYKILPDVFNSWMRILIAVEDSVLWLLEDNPSSAINLRNEAAIRGVSSDRIIFSKRMPLADHLARHRCADLFLDTFPYNAHTTGTDALWAGVPVLTRIGQSFAARVAASLLNAVGLPELITKSVEEYEQLAIKLATQPEKMQALKKKLASCRQSCKLFDTTLYVGYLEAAYTNMYERYQAGIKPDHIFVGTFGKIREIERDDLIRGRENENSLNLKQLILPTDCTPIEEVAKEISPRQIFEVTLTFQSSEPRSFKHRGTPADKGVMAQIFETKDYSISRLHRNADILAHFNKILKSGKKPLIVDAGANIGASVVWFASQFPGSHIVAFEPHPDNFDFLAANTAGIDVELYKAAVGSEDGSVSLIDPGRGEWAYQTTISEYGTSRLVSLVQILSKKLMQGFVPFIIKIDIEGGEDNLFARDTDIMHDFPLLIIELHDWLMPKKRTSQNFLKWVAKHDRDFIHIGENIFSIRNS